MQPFLNGLVGKISAKQQVVAQAGFKESGMLWCAGHQAAQLPSSLSLSHRKLNDAGAGAAFDSISMARVAPDRGVYRARVPLATATELGGADLENLKFVLREYNESVSVDRIVQN